jgi:hypothetical protein
MGNSEADIPKLEAEPLSQFDKVKRFHFIKHAKDPSSKRIEDADFRNGQFVDANGKGMTLSNAISRTPYLSAPTFATPVSSSASSQGPASSTLICGRRISLVATSAM